MAASRQIMLFILVVVSATPGCDCPSSIDRTIARDWVLRDCSRDIDPADVASLRLRGDAVVWALEDEYENGPSDSLEIAYATASLESLRRVALAPRTTDTLAFRPGLAQPHLDSSLAIGKDSAGFTNTIRRNFDRAYRSRALVGMAVVGTPRARAYLQSVATDSTLLAGNAVAILKRLPANQPLDIVQ
jgi:hypothetical protein